MNVSEPALLLFNDSSKRIALNDAVPGREIKCEDDYFLLIKRRLADVDPFAKEKCVKFRKQIQDKRKGKDEFWCANDPKSLIFLDIETCGLSAVPLFLIGIGFYTGRSFSFLQFFARDFDEERPLLSYFARIPDDNSILVTYNGKSFDIPFIASRMVENRVKFKQPDAHIDLLHEVRRRWKSDLPDCKLQTVEEHKLGFKRVGDLPGSEIPRAYMTFVDTGNADKIRGIMDHNIRDIISMIDIMSIL